MIAILGTSLAVAVPTALAILQILSNLHSSSRSLPLFIGDFVEFLVSMKRIQNFLICGEIEELGGFDFVKNDDACIEVRNANFFWGFDEKIKKKKKEPSVEAEEEKTDLELPKK